MPSFEIRLARVADAEGIARTRVSTWKDAYRGIVDDEFLGDLSIESAIERTRERLLLDASGVEPISTRFVAISEAQVVGFSTCGVKADAPYEGDWFMYALYVLPSFQGKGIGKALLMAAQEEGRRRGALRMVFGVFTANEPSKAFYYGMGAKFLETGEYELGGKTYSTDYCAYDLGVVCPQRVVHS